MGEGGAWVLQGWIVVLVGGGGQGSWSLFVGGGRWNQQDGWVGAGVRQWAALRRWILGGVCARKAMCVAMWLGGLGGGVGYAWGGLWGGGVGWLDLGC